MIEMESAGKRGKTMSIIAEATTPLMMFICIALNLWLNCP
ncbi:hypothetical protein JCM19231_3431 [Vibrio ishigakensis]|uniref:Uncharacterized protein n=1 Tax=Vibrio ishigakensis TaxID=1481914 RepID=A0A0B8P0N9_9VIBR|nr:hypothetical protein JCM19231_3431 [Vibrio ishigakensis]